MTEQKRVYLDNAATSWPKPESVYVEIDNYQRNNGMPMGRTTGTKADEVAGLVSRLRVRIQQLVNASRAETLFTQNGTDSLNFAIHGTLRPDDHVVTTVSEHNSVLRPLRHLEELGLISVTRVECDACGQVNPQALMDAIQTNTRLVAMIHCSNVTGVHNDIETVGRAIAENETLLLVDAAQSIGSSRVDFDSCKIDFLAAPGHKGLFGPLGTGILVASQKGQGAMKTIRQGGTGASSDSDRHPTGFPEAFEPGNQNVPGLVGLSAGLEFVEQVGVEAIGVHKANLANEFASRLKQIQGVEVIDSPDYRESGIVAFNLPIPAAELAVILDSTFGIQIRAGFHCASLIHSRLGFPEGCARASFGYFNSLDDVEYAADAVEEIAASF